MAEKKKNIFKRMGQYFKEVRIELKRVIWPSKDKLKKTSVVALVMIAFFAIFLYATDFIVRKGLEATGFYEIVEETTVATAAPTVSTTVATTEATEATTEATETEAEATSEEA